MSKKLSFVVVALVLAWLTGSVMAADVGKGNILIEEWLNTGQAVNADVTTLKNYAQYPDNPTRSYWAQKFDRPDGGEDYWGGRLRGYLYPPQTGDYTFWTASDDDSEVWLSTDDTAAKATMICNVEGWTDYQVYLGTSGAPGTTFKSAAIKLTAGKKYYIEAVFSDGTGGGHMSLAWGGPGIGAGPITVDGKYLAPLIRNPEPMLNAQNPSPADKAVGVVAPLITWSAGATALWHDFYFGTDPNPPLIGRQMHTVYFHIPGLEAGKTYYWRVDEIEADGVTMHQGPVWSFTAEPTKAFQPSPADGATSVLPGTVLTWLPGKGAASQKVFFGNDMAAVAAGAASVDKGSMTETKLNTGVLRASTTYYWRVDTVKADGVEQGDVWSFSTSDAGPAKKIKYEYWLNIGGTAISALTSDPRYPASPDSASFVDTIDSPVDWADNYGQRYWGWLKPPQTGDYTFWVAGDDSQEFWLSTDANPANVVLIANVAGYTGARDFDNAGGTATAAQKSAAIPLKTGEKYFFMVLGKEGGGGDSTSAAWQGPGIATREIIKSDYVDMFALMPLQAFAPTPVNNAVDTLQDGALSWTAGEQAKSHDVYFGDDAAAVAAADKTSPLFKGNQAGTAFDAGALEWGKTYSWRIDEVGTAETWKGTVWSFTTANFLAIDNMESYDDQDNRIYDTWIDGFVDSSSGSVVGYMESSNGTFGETAIVHGGKQSMPMSYDNSKAPFFSEAKQEFAPVQDWTTNGVTDLTLFVRGYPAVGEVAVTETGGKMSLTGAGADIWGASDQFTYAYKTINGDGTLVARVVSIGPGSNTWAKGGVMIRDSLNGGSASAQMVLSANTDGAAGNGAAFQNRATTDLDMGANDATSNTTSGTVIAAPYWVKIERLGDSMTGYISSNGTTWTMLGTNIIPMADPVYIGLCVTSHAAGEDRTFQFDGIASTGGVSGAWKGAVISAAVHNSGQSLYVTVEDSAGKKATVTNADAVTAATWTEVKIPLSSLTGVNLSKVKKLIVGVGDPASPAADGMGQIFVDDIRVTKP